ncbi:MAG: hypothetical protein IPL40_07075 [Proteobacteria bacterium]|nr:hypothetical protein [Pseudomonadota bacterium]
MASDAGLAFIDARSAGDAQGARGDAALSGPGEGDTPCAATIACPALRRNCCGGRCFAAACIDTLSGSGRGGVADAPLAEASFGGVQAMVADGQGNLFFTEGASAGLRVVNRGTTAIGRVAARSVGRLGGGRFGCRAGPVEVAEMRRPIGLARDPAGNLYAADNDCGAIWKLSADYRTVSLLIGQPGDTSIVDGGVGVARLGRPRGLTYHAEKLYFTDMEAHVLREVSLGPTVAVRTIAGRSGKAGTSDGPAAEALLTGPSGVTVGRDGTVFIAEYTGRTIRSVTQPGAPDAAVATAYALSSTEGSPGYGMLAAGVDGKLYAAFWNRGVFSLPAATPSTTTRVGSLASVISALPDPSGTFHWFGGWYYAAPAEGLLANTLGRYDLDGQPVEVFGTAGRIAVADGAAADATFTFASCNASLAVAGDGVVWVAERCAQRVRRIAPDGTVTSFGSGLMAESPGSARTAAFCAPVALTVVGAEVYVANALCGRRISKIDASGEVSLVGSVCVPGEPSCPQPSLAGGMVADAEGALYVSTYNESGAGNSVKYGKSGWDGMPMLVKIPALGTGTPEFFAGSPNNPTVNASQPVGSTARHGVCVDGPLGTGQFGVYPYGLALAADGTILVADSGCGVRRVARDGTISTLQRNVVGTGVAVGPGLYGAQTVLATKGDAIWALDPVTGAGVDYVSSHDWSYENHAQDGPLATATLWSPVSLAFDSAGQLLIADRLNNRIRVLRPRVP